MPGNNAPTSAIRRNEQVLSRAISVDDWSVGDDIADCIHEVICSS